MTPLLVTLPEDIAVAILESVRGYRRHCQTIASDFPNALAGLDREISILSDAITTARIDAQVRAETPPPTRAGHWCDGQHAAPACPDAECWRRDPPDGGR